MSWGEQDKREDGKKGRGTEEEKQTRWPGLVTVEEKKVKEKERNNDEGR